MAPSLQKPCQLQYPLISHRQRQPGEQKVQSRDHVLPKAHMAKQRHHRLRTIPVQISLIMSIFCAKGMANPVTAPRKVNKNKTKVFLFITIIKAIKPS